MLSDIIGNKVQEIDLAMVEVMKTQQELLSEIENVENTAFQVSVKRLLVVSSKLNQNLEIWNRFNF